ncbi:Unknown protein [Striga hermonthica]|uniref:Uncharacterized protein n=1 Tax=Striga hermonthica TaxID=68872 RepID=A0A9N7RN49_STRHE|nr:Unknown protein [Striga hermonthica]
MEGTKEVAREGLATSAAIGSELDKKKQKKKEEQERLDEEGARISEAVALHVLLSEEDSDDSCNNNINLDKDDDIIVGRRQSLIPFCHLSEYSPVGQMENYWKDSNFMVSSGSSYVGDFCCYQFFGDDVWGSISNLTARAETSLKIADDDRDYVFNHFFEWLNLTVEIAKSSPESEISNDFIGG